MRRRRISLCSRHGIGVSASKVSGPAVRKDIYTIDVASGLRTAWSAKTSMGCCFNLIFRPQDGSWSGTTQRPVTISFWDGTTARNISSAIRVPLYNEENDLPDDPARYGVMGWQEDSAVYVCMTAMMPGVFPTLPVAGPPVLFGPSGRKEKDRPVLCV